MGLTWYSTHRPFAPLMRRASARATRRTPQPAMFELLMEQVYGWGDEGAASMLSVLANTLVQIGFLVLTAVGDPASSPAWKRAT